MRPPAISFHFPFLLAHAIRVLMAILQRPASQFAALRQALSYLERAAYGVLAYRARLEPLDDPPEPVLRSAPPKAAPRRGRKDPWDQLIHRAFRLIATLSDRERALARMARRIARNADLGVRLGEVYAAVVEEAAPAILFTLPPVPDDDLLNTS